MNDHRAQVLAYHQATKHQFDAYARGPNYLEWATQPEPFRRYQGAPLIALEKTPPGEYPPFELALHTGNVPTAPLNHHSLSQLLFDSLAISAWKQAGDASWALRVNTSSGNLHPTEGYLICGPIHGLSDTPAVYQSRAVCRRWWIPSNTPGRSSELRASMARAEKSALGRARGFGPHRVAGKISR